MDFKIRDTFIGYGKIFWESLNYPLLFIILTEMEMQKKPLLQKGKKLPDL